MRVADVERGREEINASASMARSLRIDGRDREVRRGRIPEVAALRAAGGDERRRRRRRGAAADFFFGGPP